MSEDNEHEDAMPDDPAPDTPPPDIQAVVDQLIASMPEMVRACRCYFDAFVEQGFSRRESLYLTVAQFKDSPGQPPS